MFPKQPEYMITGSRHNLGKIEKDPIVKIGSETVNKVHTQPRPQAQPLPLRGYCVENTVGNARSGLAENAEKSV